MTNSLVELYLQVVIFEGDAEDVENDTHQLHKELDHIGFSVMENIVYGQLPNGAKGVDPILIGTLAVMVVPTILANFLNFLHDWAMRKEGRVLKIKVQSEFGEFIEIEIPTDLSKKETQKWIDMLREDLIKLHKKGKISKTRKQ